MKKILYIAREPQALLSGGASVDSRNLRTLKSIYGNGNVVVEYLPKSTLKSVALSLLTLSSYGVNYIREKKILQSRRLNNCQLIFIEGSFTGNLVYQLSMQGCKVILHMHNIEAKLYRSRLNYEKGLIPWLRYAFIRYNEKLSVKYAAAIINLNQRDSEDMLELYNRKADIILPITFPKRQHDNDSIGVGDYLLFVGSDFFPNIEGLIWFIKNVAPYVKTIIKVVGSCCNNPMLQAIKLPSNVKLVGYVNNLSTYYSYASAIIAPIFSGSGMKTKTIEAMSFGKTIIGTNEAFVGIESSEHSNSIGFRCNTAEEFIDAINKFDQNRINPMTLKVFENTFTDDVFRVKLRQFLTTID